MKIFHGQRLIFFKNKKGKMLFGVIFKTIFLWKKIFFILKVPF